MVSDLQSLKPIYFRLDQIAKQFPDDFDVQLACGDLKQRLVNRGKFLKDAAMAATGASPVPPQQQPSGQFGAPGRPGGQFGAPPPMPGGSPSGQFGSAPPPMPGGPMGAPPPTPGPMGAPPPMPGGPPLVSPSITSMATAAVQTPPPFEAVAPPPAPGTTGQQAGRTSATQYQARSGSNAVAAPPPKKPGLNVKRAILIGAGIGLVSAVGIFVGIVQYARSKNKPNAPSTTGIVEITTTPPGAQIKINGQDKCVSNCKEELAPGNYQITATLAGFDPTATGVTVTAGSSIPVSLSLTPLAQTLRIITDLQAGKVTLDGQPAGDLQDGQLIIDRINPGRHQVAVTGPTGGGSFEFEAVPGKAPVITGPATAKDMIAILLSGYGQSARLQTSSGPLKVMLDGQARGDVSQAGLDLSGVALGDHELVVGEGKDQKKVVIQIVANPTLTAYLKSDVNAGWLVVVTNEDDVQVLLNGRAYPRKTSRGQIRILQPPSNVNVRVVKDGFQDEREQQAAVKKGEETRLEFKMRALPRVAGLRIRGATPGAAVLLDKREIGRIGPDGTFSTAGVAPGEGKTIELALAGYAPLSLTRSFKAGETVELAGADVVLRRAGSTLRLVVNPAFPESKVTVRRENESAARNVTEATLADLPPGTYVFVARATGFTERTERVTLGAGENRSVDLTLTREKQQAVQRPGTIADFEGTFTKEGDGYVAKGPGILPMRITPTAGTFSFTLQLTKGGGAFGTGKKLKWALDYPDNAGYARFELEKGKFVSRLGTGAERHRQNLSQRSDNLRFTVTIQVTATKIVHTVDGEVVDVWEDAARNFTDGRFAFILDNKDEVQVTGFRFTPAAK